MQCVKHILYSEIIAKNRINKFYYFFLATLFNIVFVMLGNATICIVPITGIINSLSITTHKNL